MLQYAPFESESDSDAEIETTPAPTAPPTKKIINSNEIYKYLISFFIFGLVVLDTFRE